MSCLTARGFHPEILNITISMPMGAGDRLAHGAGAGNPFVIIHAALTAESLARRSV